MIAVTAGDKIILVGGFLGARHADAINNVSEYDPARNSWRALAPIKSPLGAVGLAYVDGKVHALAAAAPDLKTVVTHQVLDHQDRCLE